MIDYILSLLPRLQQYSKGQMRREKLKLIESIRSKLELEIVREEIDFEKNRKARIDLLNYYATFLAKSDFYHSGSPKGYPVML